MDKKSFVRDLIGSIFGAIFLAIGFVNTFWGNDQVFGIFIVLLSLVYFSPFNELLRRKLGFAVPGTLKILLGVFIFWAALGVGELFAKIELMKESF